VGADAAAMFAVVSGEEIDAVRARVLDAAEALGEVRAVLQRPEASLGEWVNLVVMKRASLVLLAISACYSSPRPRQATPGDQIYTGPMEAPAEGSASCLPNGSYRDGLMGGEACCSGKVHEIYKDPNNQYSGTKGVTCCGSRDDGVSPECK
jgi:hypothetical protein